MEQFPPLGQSRTQKKGLITKLKEMFPSIEDDVIEMVLEEAHGDFNSTAEILLSMVGEMDENSGIAANVDSATSVNPFLLAASALLATDSRDSPSIDGALGHSSWSDTSRPVSESRGHDSNNSGDDLDGQDADREVRPTSLEQEAPLPSQAEVEQFQDLEKAFEQHIGLTELPSPIVTFEEGIPELIENVRIGRRAMLILRGPPGSGKTTLAKKYIEFLKIGSIFSTDDFFYKNGRYAFNAGELSQAHEFNQSQVRAALQRRDGLVIVDNTNTMSWEMRPYLVMAAEQGYLLYLQEPPTAWFNNPKELAKRNTHYVPKQKIEIMLGRYEQNVTIDNLLTRYNIDYKPVAAAPVTAAEEDSDDIYQSDEESEDDEEENERNETAVCSDTVTPLAYEVMPDVEEAAAAPPQQHMAYFEPVCVEPAQNQYLSFVVPCWDVDQSSPATGECSGWSSPATPSDGGGAPNNEAEDPKPPRIPRARKRQLDITSEVWAASYLQPGSDEAEAGGGEHGGAADDSSFIPPGVEPSPVPTEPTMSFSMDPMFAVQLQEAFGPPLEDSLLQFLDLNEVLTASIPFSLAQQFFVCWQESLRNQISSKLEKVASAASDPCPVPGISSSSPSTPAKTVLAPNAVEYYDAKLLERVMNESKTAAEQQNKRPTIVVKSQSADHILNHVECDTDDLEVYRNKRNLLYRKAMEARANKSGAAGYYATEAREANKQLKLLQQDKQIEMYRIANEHNSPNKLDLHFLTTTDAIKQLNGFIQSRFAVLRKSGAEELTVEIVTGKGNRSDNGKSRLRPAVVNWLHQKNLRYSEINSGSLKVYLKNDRASSM